GAALVLGPAALHRRTAVDHELGALHCAVDRGRIAEVAERVLDALHRMLRDAAHEHAQALALADQALDDRAAERARRAGDEVRHALRQRELREARGLIGVRGARDLLDPAYDLRGIVDAHRRWLPRGEPAIEVGDEIAQ